MARTEVVTFTNICMIENGQDSVVVQQRTDNWPTWRFPEDTWSRARVSPEQ